MLKKLLIGGLTLTVLSAGGAAVAYQAGAKQAATPEPMIAQVEEQAEQLLQDQTNSQGYGEGQQNHGEAERQQQNAALETIGEPWMASGVISWFDTVGMNMTLADGNEIYTELGPQDYWQNQGVALATGSQVTVEGFANAEQYHAGVVTTADGQQLVLRTPEGLPMWGGGANGQGQGGQGNGAVDGSHEQEPQAQVDEWVTLEGVLTEVARGRFTMQLADGVLVSFQAGQPRFFESQGVVFYVGDQVAIVGFYENENFMAGDITKVLTGERVMLRDPNGRPLWAGPGNSNGNSNGGNGSGNGGA